MVAVLVQIVTTIKQLLYFIDVFLGIANLVINHSGSSHYLIVVECIVIHICLLSIPIQIIEFIDVNTISRIRDDFVDPFGVSIILMVSDKITNKLFLVLCNLLAQLGVCL